MTTDLTVLVASCRGEAVTPLHDEEPCHGCPTYTTFAVQCRCGLILCPACQRQHQQGQLTTTS